MFTRFLIFLCLLLSTQAYANLFGKPTFLPAQKAFAFSHQESAEKLQLNWQIAEGYYLYQQEIKISSKQGNLTNLPFPKGEAYHDEFFGDVEIYRNQLALEIPINELKESVSVRYQGCTQGFCYPPEEVTITLGEATAKTSTQSSLPAIATQNPTVTANEQDKLATLLLNNRFSIFLFFALGIGLAFTPCVLPMLPLLSAIVLGRQQRPSTAKAFALSFVYVQGMALTYTLLGLIVAAIGMPFQVALQSPPVLLGLSMLFVLLALSMFGLFSLELPQSWQQKINNLSQKQQGGAFGSVFVMGMIAGLVASPCTSAPLSGALLYVAQSGDLLTGGLALYLLALGMGLPLILITLFGHTILPKSGDWLLKVKTLFGFILLALPVFLISRIFPEWEMLLWSGLAVTFLVWLYEQIPTPHWLGKIAKGALLLALLFAGKPLSDMLWQTPSTQTVPHSTFIRIHSLAELQTQLSENPGKKVMLDLYADWCVACKEFEKYTFNEPQVKAKLKEMLVLQIDMTQNSAANDELMKHFQILGLPTILFFDENGQLLPQRITGFLQAEPFLQQLNAL